MSAEGSPSMNDYRSYRLNFLWLEITGRCQLDCEHCYADSGPMGTHGSMTIELWKSVIDQAAVLGAKAVQFIGGEPTLHPGLTKLIRHSLARGMEVEVFSNLLRIPRSLWDEFSRSGIRLATSYYSDDASQHNGITGLIGSHENTRNGIKEALLRGIPLRVGVIGVRRGQNVGRAVRELKSLGVSNIGIDYLREVGRGQREQIQDMTQLCGQCASGVLAVGPDGAVWPCVFSRWLPVGNLARQSLKEVVHGEDLRVTQKALANSFNSRSHDYDLNHCPPDCDPCRCGPLRCDPGRCQPFWRCVPRHCGPDSST